MSQQPASTLAGFRSRASQAESKITALEAKVSALKATSQRPITSAAVDESKPNTIQPDKTFPPWYTPYGVGEEPKGDNAIMVTNSLLPGTKVPFVPKNGRLVKWYTCGPTVYAPSHMGHARTYITFDIIRNILEYYFGFRVNLVMNITDVDDKIILKARQNHLYEQYVAAKHPSKKITDDLTTAFNYAVQTREDAVKDAQEQLKTAQEKHKKDVQAALQGEQVKLEGVAKSHTQFTSKLKSNPDAIDQLLRIGQSALSEWLDKQFGHTVTDQKIYRAHGERFEKEFFEDTRRLNIRDPDVLTRVTEYIPQIITFVEKLVSNGYAYESNGSVYFDVDHYRKFHDFPKLDPKKMDSELLMTEGEGALSAGFASEKKSPRDFALWKASKVGEPQWESSWGKGRPGWHIECSAMAGDVLGDNMDIHTGGEDLKFPHHDNECAQSSAFFSDPSKGVYHQQWVNYWFHAGHLHIHGLKMSKSLKNFITIREALEMCTTRQIRIMFLLQAWNNQMDYSDGSIEETRAKEQSLLEFFLHVNAYNRVGGQPSIVASTNYAPNKLETSLNTQIVARQIEVDRALRNDFGYPSAMKSIFGLITDVNTYVKGLDSDVRPHILLINKAADFINDMLKVFGVFPKTESHFLGSDQLKNEAYLQSVLDIITSYRNELAQLFRSKAEVSQYTATIESYGKSITQLSAENESKSESTSDVSPSLQQTRESLHSLLSQFHQNVSQLFQSPNADPKQLLKFTDELRDGSLPKYGVLLEDLEGGKGSLWKLYDADYLVKYLVSEQNAKLRKKCKNRIAQLEKDLEVRRGKSLPPSEYFKRAKDRKTGELLYSQFDDSGMPTHDSKGAEVSKKLKKKLGKEFNKQDKAYKQFQKQLETNPNLLKDLESQLETERLNLNNLM